MDARLLEDRLPERGRAGPVVSGGDRKKAFAGTPATSAADAGIAHADLRHRVIDLETPCQCLGREGGRVLTSFLARSRAA